MTMTIFRAGNSAAITIPHDLLKEMGLKIGQKVSLEKIPETNKLIVSSVKENTQSTGLSLEFKKWLTGFLQEDGQLLDELEKR